MSDLANKYPYLNYLERPLDDQQIKVCCRTDNSVVAAGAGSGKTQVLASRFAWLCMEFDDISASEILTLTFTKKAAAEMYLRIYQTLNRFANAPEDKVPARQRKNAKRALEDFANVHIQTLDSYCGGIVRQGANRYGIRPDFVTGGNNDIKNLALPFILNHLESPAVKHFAEAGKIKQFSDTFASIVESCTTLASEKGCFSRKIPLQRKEIVRAWNEVVCGNETGSINDLVNQLLSIWKDPEGREQCSTYKDTFFSPVLDGHQVEPVRISEEEIFINRDENSLSRVRAYIEWTEGFCWPGIRGKTKPFVTEMKQVIKQIKDKREEILRIYSFIEDYSSIVDLFRLLDEFTEKINGAKRISGQLTFSDVSEMALKILIEQKDIRNQEKAAYKKIMIDEFQDNNGKNRDLLFLLSEAQDSFVTLPEGENSPDTLHRLLKDRIVKDKLFFVGDEKQSIYKFRGADVAVFNQLKDDLAEINGPDSYLHMIYNYRSVPELLTSFNTMFGGFIPDGSGFKKGENGGIFLAESEDKFEALYTDSANARFVDKETHKEQAPCVLNAENVAGHFEVLVDDKAFKDGTNGDEKYLSAADQQNYRIAEKIRELKENGAKYSEIAILDRARSSRGNLMLWLERFEIPYELDEQSNVFGDGPVNDIYHFLRLCIYPSDQTSMAAYLCSPFAGLSENEMERILVTVQDFKDESVAKIKEKFGDESSICKKFVKAAEFYNNQQSSTLSRPITETLNVLWYDCGYRYETLLNSTVNIFAEQYDFLFETARQNDVQGQSVSWFVDQLESIKASESAELDIKNVTYPVERKDAVQIMTIHKSKGLQFNHVFLMGCLGGTKKDSQSTYFYDPQFGLTIKPDSGKDNYFFRKQQEISDRKSFAEFRRLIYVGITRAVKDFYVVGTISITKDGESTDKEDAYILNLLKACFPDFWTDERNQFYTENAPFDLKKIIPVSKAVLGDFRKSESLDLRREKDMKIAAELYGRIKASEKNFITAPVVEYKKNTPSGLEKSQEECEALQKIAPEGTDNYSTFLEKLISDAKKEKNKFDPSDFGTLVHKYLELHHKGIADERIRAETLVPFSFFKESDLEQLHQTCISICRRFDATSAGTLLKSAREAGRQTETEYGFKMVQDGSLITGSIDLFFENADGTYTIVDYKTDQEICPEKYLVQQECYKKALCALKGLEEKAVNCVLYYARYDQLENLKL